jgi:phosphoglycolate phosphatase-like HAD superfamily hydrolase
MKTDAFFLDFDGVIIDSINECYLVSRDLFCDLESQISVPAEQETLFLKYRGIVGPAWQMYALQKAIALHIKGNPHDIQTLYRKICNHLGTQSCEKIENAFFSMRKKYQVNAKEWFKLNPLTEYGKTLQNRNLPNYHIVTTKNRNAVEQLNAHYHINIPSIYDVEDYRVYKSKGAILAMIMEQEGYQNAIFLDDFTKHLDTVQDSRIQCYFADWGYGENTKYPVYSKELWNCP